jgi:hypothetical protein
MKKVKLRLEGLDGNAYSLLGAFQHHARRDGWTADEIAEVTTRAKAGDYDNLLRTLMDVCVDPEEDDDAT